MDSIREGKATLVAAELLASTKIVLPDMYSEILDDPLPISNPDKYVTEYMKMVKYSGDCENEKPIIQFHKYSPKEPVNLLSMVSLLNANNQEIDSKTQPLRVNCTCRDYKLYFADSNFYADAQYGIRVNAIDPSEEYDRRGQEVAINEEDLPGMCQHILSLYIYLRNLGKVR
jgi:hypothetical protein